MNLKFTSKNTLKRIFTRLSEIFIKKSDIVDNLSSTDTNKPLSAKQGKVLNESISTLNSNKLSCKVKFYSYYGAITKGTSVVISGNDSFSYGKVYAISVIVKGTTTGSDDNGYAYLNSNGKIQYKAGTSSDSTNIRVAVIYN